MFGYGDLHYVDLGPYVDQAYLAALRTASGIELTELVGLVDAAMGSINATRDPVVASLVYETTDPVGSARSTTAKHVQVGGEYTVARPQIGKAAANMLPIFDREIGFAWTEKGLKRVSRTAFNRELQDMVDAWDRLYKAEVLWRLFSPAEVPVDTVGTTATSPGFAGSGTGTNVFSGVFPNGQPIPGGYTHYVVTTTANLKAAMITYRDQLAKWHRPPYDLIASASALSAIKTALGTDYVAAGSALIRRGGLNDEAAVDPDTYVGVALDNIRVRQPVDEIGTTTHFSLYKTFGAFASGNPLGWRFDEAEGNDVRTVGRAMYPLAEAVVQHHFGIGVSDRVAAVDFFIDAGGSYLPPSIQF